MDAIRERIGDKKINTYLMWSFRNLKDRINPFNNDVDFDDMPCVLGLKGKNPSFICITHKLPEDIKIHCPTAFNAGVDSASYAWEPGGKKFHYQCVVINIAKVCLKWFMNQTILTIYVIQL